MTGRTPAAGLRRRLWDAVSAGDEHTAFGVLDRAAADGVDEETLLLDVIAPVQERIGAEWAADRVSVVQEHAVTARLVAEVLALRGWRVDCLGAQTPIPHLVAHLHRTDPCAVLLSGSVPTRLPTAHTAVTACQAIGVPVLAGGRAFGPDGRHARALGADRWAADARGAAAVLAAGLPRAGPSVTRQAVDDLPHLTDQEYTLVVRSRPRLVRQALADLETGFPAVRAHGEAQRERTAEDIAHIVDFLATALYLDDAEVFTAFLTWTAAVLEARRVPAWSLVSGLDALAGRLHDFPRALELLRLGTAALLDSPARPGPAPYGHS
ncbi:cobalamin-dependent protein [Streptomyces griseoviridis]|uniref:Cobalamin-binding protein n=1 Tax=Streptomyces griseoviridis TaxID=45398 RepID=A0A918GF94_STRGD|nr:cobalamin-dependent protein [Streptomyces niveoruber]GGS34023.1 cobalamin-binding protein [Streptomyces niveoruber]